MKTKVLFIGLNFSPEHTGIAPYSSEMVAGLKSFGFAMDVITSQPHYPEWRILDGHKKWSTVHHEEDLRLRRLLHYVPSRPSIFSRVFSEVSFGARAIFSRWGRPDLLILVSPALISSAMCLLKAKVFYPKVPVTLWLQDLYAVGMSETSKGTGFASQVLHVIEGMLVRKVSHLVVIHERFASRLREDYSVLSRKIDVVRNWAHVSSTKTSRRRKVRTSLGWEENDFIVLHTGNMGVKQGLENVIEAARLSDKAKSHVKFVLMGQGSKRASLESQALGVDSLQIVDPVPEVNYAEVLQAADALLVNELKGVAEMSVPSKLTSYMQSGVPVLAATALGGATSDEILTSGCGLVVENGNPGALLAGAIRLSSDSSLRVSFGTNGISFAKENYSRGAAVDRFVSLLNQLKPPRPK